MLQSPMQDPAAKKGNGSVLVGRQKGCLSFLTVEEQKTLNAIKEKLQNGVQGQNPTPDEIAVYRRLQDKYSAHTTKRWRPQKPVREPSTK